MPDWKPGNPLPEAQNAQINPRKFYEYSMNPENPHSGGKWKAFEQIGYDVYTPQGRSIGTQNLIEQLRLSLQNAPANQGKTSTYGSRFVVRVEVKGPNKKKGTLITIWQVDKCKSFPKLITNWIEVDK
ncbi:MAG: DUF6883 domain-containing protein [Gloeobacterales cyanobacterium]